MTYVVSRNAIELSNGAWLLCEPDDGGGERNEGRESLSQLIVAGGDTAKLLDPAKETLNEVTTFVAVFIKHPLNQTVAPWRNHRFDVGGMQIVDDGIAVVGFVGTDRARFQVLKERQCLGAVTGLPSGQAESRQTTQPLDQGMNLRAQSAAGSPERLVTVFFAAPAAC